MRRSSSQSGFAMPLTLAIVAVMAYLVATGVQRVEVARAEARLAQSNVEEITDLSRIEQDVVWRGVLELLGKSSIGDSPQFDRYLARPPDTEWKADGMPRIWRPVYSDPYGRNLPTALVMIRDEASKLDVNSPVKGYISLLAERAGLSSGVRSRAVDAHLDYVSDRTPRAINNDDVLRLPHRSGMLDPLEICGLEGWSEWDLCEDEEAVRSLFTAGVGLIPNMDMLSADAARFLLGRSDRQDLASRNTEWRELRARNEFYDPLEGTGLGGVRFDVTILIRNSNRALRFILDTRTQERNEPFAIKTLRYVPADRVVEEVRRLDPAVLGKFASSD
ncbi:MAG: hypothetical protein AAF311_06030 [Pseudomonadota bacterium]